MRRKRRIEPPVSPKSRAELEALYPGEVWDTAQLAAAGFVITAIIDNEVVVRRRDNVVGTLTVQQQGPTLYFNFRPQPSAETE